jgi:hypothetical protein
MTHNSTNNTRSARSPDRMMNELAVVNNYRNCSEQINNNRTSEPSLVQHERRTDALVHGIIARIAVRTRETSALDDKLLNTHGRN